VEMQNIIYQSQYLSQAVYDEVISRPNETGAP
jgi:hypothetical protein